MTDNLPNLAEAVSLQIQEAERIPNRINPKKFTARHIKLLKTEIKKTLWKQQERNNTLPIGGKLFKWQ